MDIILSGMCRFFIATSSGLWTVAKAFGRPVVQTNYAAPSSLVLNKDDILGFRFQRPPNKLITEECNIFDFSRHLHSKLIDICRKYRKNKDVELKNEIIIEGRNSEISECIKLMKDREIRKEYVNHGRAAANEFLKLRS